MSRSCERCWEQAALRCFGDTSKTQTEHYYELLAENQAAHSHQSGAEVQSDGLMDALKRADFECVGKGGMFLKELDVFERRVREWYEREVAALKAEVAEHDELMNQQHERTAEADKAWQKATGKEGVLPDLGTLVEWLMGRAADAEAEVARLREIAGEGKP
jgi:hypothetical protein